MGCGGYCGELKGHFTAGSRWEGESGEHAVAQSASYNALNAQLAYGIEARGKFPPIDMVSGLSASQFPVVYNDGQQVRKN